MQNFFVQAEDGSMRSGEKHFAILTYENGHCRDPRWSSLRRMARVLGVGLLDLEEPEGWERNLIFPA
jgi:hypothetical protein